MDDIITVLLTAAFSALLGGLVGYRLGIVSERRKEYNEIADKLFINVNREVGEHSAGQFYIYEDDIALIRRRMGRLQRRRFDTAYDDYLSASERRRRDVTGQVFYSDVDSVNAALKQIAAVLKRR